MAEKGAMALKKEADEKETASRRVHDEMSHLTAAKDRAQLSQASAMSILDVTILAELIRRGDDYTMRVPLLVLVSLALLLQITVGFLSLMISNIKTRYQSFGLGRAICCIGRPFKEKELDEEDNRRWEAVTAARTVGGGGGGGGGVIFGLESDEAGSISSGYEPDVPDGARTPLSILSYTDELDEQCKALQSETIQPTLADIYGTTPPADKVAHVPAPYDQPTLRMKEPRNMKAKTVVRLQAWVEQMIESKEAEIETQINVEFLEGELAKREEKLQHLQQTVAELKEEEDALATEWKATREEWQKVITEKLQLENEFQNKESELKRLPVQLKDNDNTTRRSQLKKELQLLKQQLKLVEAEEKHAHEKLRHVEKQRRKGREAKTDVEHVESEIRLIKQEKEQKERGAREFRVKEGRFKFYQKMAEEIEKRKTLERVMFWQSIINYILYSVFVMNAFIATMSMISD